MCHISPMNKINIWIFLALNVTYVFIRRLTNSTLLIDQILIIAIFSIFTYGIVSILVFEKRQLFRNNFTSFLLTIIIVVNFVTFVPATIERSRSFYVIAWLPEDGKFVQESKILTLAEVSGENNLQAIKQRLREHSVRGLVKEICVQENCKFKLTSGGILMLRMADIIAYIYKLDNYKKQRQVGKL